MSSYLQTPVALALGRALVHFLWEGALLGLLLAVTLWLGRGRGGLRGRRRPRACPTPLFRYTAATLTLLAMTMSFVLTFVILLPGVPPAPRLEIALPVPPPALPVAPAAVSAPLAPDPQWMVLAFLRPAVLTPVGLHASFPAAQAELILIHELAHIRRRDYLVNLLQGAAEGLLFYHPAVWWVSKVIRTERENCCDDIALEMQGDRRSYADALLQLEEARQMVMAATGGNLSSRVRRILYGRESRDASEPIAAVAALALLASGLVLASHPTRNTPTPIVKPAAPVAAPRLVAQAQPIPQRNPLASPAQSDPYERWLNEEVPYIITQDESLAFQQLRTDAERQQFIEQFWLRRDPTPDTPQNEMQEEHYRRIAYANDRFGTATVAGWQSDRGRVYIKFGPPDEKEQRPDRETWRYANIEGVRNMICEFVDLKGDGEFRMTVDPSEQANRRPLREDELQLEVGQRPDGPVALRIAASDEVTVYLRITTGSRRPVALMEEGPTRLVEKELSLPPGTYELTVVLSAEPAGAIGMRQLRFEVK